MNSFSLLAQINSLQADYNKLEGEVSKHSQSEKEVKQELNQLLADQTRLQRLHDQLQSDYDRLTEEREELKSSERLLREEIKKFKDSADTVNQSQDDIIKAKEVIDKERQDLKIDKKTLSNLRSEHSRLKDDFRSVDHLFFTGFSFHDIFFYFLIIIISLLGSLHSPLIN